MVKMMPDNLVLAGIRWHVTAVAVVGAQLPGARHPTRGAGGLKTTVVALYLVSLLIAAD